MPGLCSVHNRQPREIKKPRNRVTGGGASELVLQQGLPTMSVPPNSTYVQSARNNTEWTHEEFRIFLEDLTLQPDGDIVGPPDTWPQWTDQRWAIIPSTGPVPGLPSETDYPF
jgi:hypothetical protein